MNRSNDDYQNTGCIKCGDCCETFLMAEDLINKHRTSFQRIVIHEQRFPKIGQILIKTIDGKCVFLLPNNFCSIYHDRPLIPCKVHGIPKYIECPTVSPDGKKRSRKEYDRIVAKNTNKSRWSMEYKKLLKEEAKKCADEFVKKQDNQKD